MTSRSSKTLIACALAAAGALTACAEKEGGITLPPVTATEPVPIEVSAAPLRATPVVTPVEVTGTATAIRVAEIGSPLAARVEAIAVTEGQRVEEGDLLVRLDDQQARLQASQAAAAASAAKVQADLAAAERERLGPLAERGTIAPSRLDQLAAQADAAEANARAARSATWAAQRMVVDTKVTAPFAGTVVDVAVELGELPMRAPYLVRLVDLSTLEVTARVHARELAHLAVGDPIVAKFPDLERTVEGKLGRLGREIDPATRTVEVVAQIDNPDGAIPSGIFAEVRITPTVERRGLVVPRAAVAEGEGGSIVYTVDGNVARAHPVRVRAIDSQRLEIVEGVAAGAVLVMSGVDGLVDGALVARRSASAKAPAETARAEAEPVSPREAREEAVQ